MADLDARSDTKAEPKGDFTLDSPIHFVQRGKARRSTAGFWRVLMSRQIFTKVVILALFLAFSSAAFAQCSGNVCTSSSGITITGGSASAYPSTITVSGLTGSVTKVTLTLHTVNVTNNFDVAYLVQSPSPSL